MKTKHQYIELEEALILMGYDLSRERAFSLMNTWAKRHWGDVLTENMADLTAITELTSVQKDYGETDYSWKSEVRELGGSRILGWVYTI